MLINSKFLKLFYNALLTGMPSLTYNPINKNILHAPFTVNKYSTYINYKLDYHQIHTINKFMEERNDLTIIPLSLINDETKDFILSINIYNCSSPIFDFITDEPSTRCEINIYVKNNVNKEKGTLIIDYASNILSLDPENLFKLSNYVHFLHHNQYIFGNAINDNFILNFNYNHNSNICRSNKLHNDLIEFTDKIYYPNGIYDKVYYDSSLIKNDIILCNEFNIYFKFLNMEFTNIHSVFYFENNINFVGGLWFNLYD